MLPAALAAAWLAVVWLAKDAVKRAWPGEVLGYFSNAPGQWHSALALPTSGVIFPVLFVLAWHSHGWSLEDWSEHMRAGGAGGTWERTFLYIFVLFYMLDFALVEVRGLIVAHHVACLGGHTFAYFVLPAGFPYYMAGCVALELGTSVSHAYCLNQALPPRRSALALLAVGMTLSNLASLACLGLWVLAVEPNRAGQTFAILTTVILVYLRQAENVNAVRADTRDDVKRGS